MEICSFKQLKIRFLEMIGLHKIVSVSTANWT